MVTQHPRIVSLIPSATEIVAALGLAEYLVGRSHECDYPSEVTQLPICTAPNLDPQGTSRQIHDRVSDLLQASLSIYRIDLAQLEQLQPTHILTQAQCEVCAVSLAEVQEAVAHLTHCQAEIISLQPQTLADVWQDIARVAVAFGVDSRPLLAQLQARVQFCQQQTQNLPVPKVACVEWTDPLMAAGNWVPELVRLAGGTNLFGISGEHSPWITWDDLVQVQPEMLIFMPCGFDLAQTEAAVKALQQTLPWQELLAVRQVGAASPKENRIYLVDGNQYFNRPGPRLVDSLEILAEILHPQVCQFGYQGTGWTPFASVP